MISNMSLMSVLEEHNGKPCECIAYIVYIDTPQAIVPCNLPN